MSHYVDAGVLVALFTIDALTEAADSFLRRHQPTVLVSDFAGAELASAVARRVRTGELSVDEARSVFTNFDAWTGRLGARIETGATDIATAASFLRRLDLTLRTPDALHIAIAQRLGAELLTFDAKMAVSARALGVSVSSV